MLSNSNPRQHSWVFNEQERGELKRSITQLCEGILGLTELREDQELFSLGGDLILGRRFLDQICERFDVKIDVSVLRDSLTVAKLADLVLLKQAAVEFMCLVPIRSEGDLAPLFLIHGVGGNVLGFFNLARKIPDGRPVYGIQSQALYSDGAALIRIPDMAACYLQEVRRLQPVGPYHFTGFSFGGLIAYEMAQQLRAQGEEVGLLSMLDTWQPSDMRNRHIVGPFSSKSRQHVASVYSGMRGLSLSSKLLFASIKIRNRAFHVFYHYAIHSGQVSITRRMKNVRELNRMAAMQYELKPYAGKVMLLRASDELDNGLPLDLGWSEFAEEGVEIFHFPGDHGQVLAEPNVSVVGDILNSCLERSNDRVTVVI